MRHLRRILLCGTGLLASASLAPGTVHAQTADAARTALLVSPAWLAQHQHDADLVILHMGTPQGYEAQHIAGARLLSLNDLSTPTDRADRTRLTLELPDPETLRAHLAAAGISDNSRIVLYYANNEVTQATRALLTLDYAGFSTRTSVLDGGMGAWIREGHEVTNVVPPAHIGTLSSLRTHQVVVTADFVKAHIAKPGTSIVDARATAYYDGVQAGGSTNAPQPAGHIASAKSIPYSEITNDQYLVRSPAELTALFAKAGVQRGDTVIAYCHIGQQGTAVVFAARTLGMTALLYDGSMEDWVRHAGYPMENPSARKP